MNIYVPSFDQTLSFDEYERQIEEHRQTIESQYAQLDTSSKDTPKNIHTEFIKFRDNDLSAWSLMATHIYFGRGFTENKALAIDIMKTLALGAEGQKSALLQYIYALHLWDFGSEHQETAAEYMQYLSDEDFLPAIARYGSFLEVGKGVAQNSLLAEEHYTKAAARGHFMGTALLARLRMSKPGIRSTLQGTYLLIKLIILKPVVSIRSKRQYDERYFYL